MIVNGTTLNKRSNGTKKHNSTPHDRQQYLKPIPYSQLLITPKTLLLWWKIRTSFIITLIDDWSWLFSLRQYPCVNFGNRNYRYIECIPIWTNRGFIYRLCSCYAVNQNSYFFMSFFVRWCSFSFLMLCLFP